MVAALDQGVSSPVLLPLRRMITTFAFVVGFIAFVVACSGTPDPVRPAQQAGETPSADADGPDSSDGDDPDDQSPGDSADGEQPDDEPKLNLEDQVKKTVTLSVGEHVEDAAGNVVVVYEIAPWPVAYRRTDAFGSDDLELVGGIESAFGGKVESLVAIDLGMCAPGDFQESIDGQALFSISGSPTEPLSAELSAPIKTGHPILEPHFEMPDPAVCSRGWMVIGSTRAAASAEAPVARYVLSAGQTDSDASDLLYQWLADTPAQVPSGVEPFSAGETVTFNEGSLSGVTVKVNGWTELLNSDSPVAETRLVGVSLDVCLQDRWPRFGMGVDGWNLAGQVDQADQLGFELADDHELGDCYSGWLDFVVPIGGVPTGFFASDGGDSLTGFASWSLDGAALPAPE